MKFVSFAAAASVALLSTAAQAQDERPMFEGPRIEARIGWDKPELRGTVSDGVNQISRESGKSGASYGGEVGYDHSLGHVVIGGYVGLEDSSAKICTELYGNDRACARASRNITAGARVGAPFGESFMLYAKGGYSNGSVSVDYQDYDLQFADFNESRDFDGYHVGAGFEASMGRRVYGRLEYVYSGYDEASAVSLGTDNYTLKPSRHQVAYAMGVRF